MKLAYIRVQIIGVLLLVSLLPLRISAANDTISTFPFSEDWGSGSFDTNHWTFPDGQGNWTILPNEGSPPPTAAFTGDPYQTNYSFTLESPFFDAGNLYCDDLFLDFDLFLQSNYLTGTEHLAVILKRKYFQDTLLALNNFENVSWNHFHLSLENTPPDVFKIKFQVSGISSNNISSWRIDNISVTRECRVATAMYVNSDWSGPFCINSLYWVPPDCDYQHTIPMPFIFDDGTWENYYRGDPGSSVSFGNLFPISGTLNGILTSFEIYMVDDSTGSPQNFTLEVYDVSKTIIGSSDPFTGAPTNEWIVIPVSPGIPFSGPFYAMLKWNNPTGESYYLAADENGPYSSEDLAFKFDGTTWTHPSTTPSVFLLRANALVEYKLKKIPLKIDVTDSNYVTGYNIYRVKEYSYDTILLNDVPVTEPQYIDTVPFYFTFYYGYAVKAIYNDGCESDFSDWPVTHGCITGIDQKSNDEYITVSPNPATDKVYITSKFPLYSVRLSDMKGVTVFERKDIKMKDLIVDISQYPAGIYFVSVVTDFGPASVKLLIFR